MVTGKNTANKKTIKNTLVTKGAMNIEKKGMIIQDFYKILDSNPADYSTDELRILKTRIPQALKGLKEYADNLNRDYGREEVGNYEINAWQAAVWLRNFHNEFKNHSDRNNYAVMLLNTLDQHSNIEIKFPLSERSYKKRIQSEIDSLLKKYPAPHEYHAAGGISGVKDLRELILTLGTNSFEYIISGIESDIEKKQIKSDKIKGILENIGLFSPNVDYDSGGLKNSARWAEIEKQVQEFMTAVEHKLDPKTDIDSKKIALKTRAGELKGKTSGIEIAYRNAEQKINAQKEEQAKEKERLKQAKRENRDKVIGSVYKDLMSGVPSRMANAKKILLGFDKETRASILRKVDNDKKVQACFL